MSENTSPVLIIGAGTGGLALAHGLRAAGVPVQVYERDRHRTGGLQGFRVGISPNGVRALRECLPAELFEIFVLTTANEYEHYTTCTEQLKPLFTISGAKRNGGTGDVVRDYSVSRMTLRQVLLTGLEDVVHFDKEFTGFTEHGTAVTAHFADGTSAAGALLVGADGANSRTRKQHLPGARQTETGLIAIGGKQAITTSNTGLLTGANRNGMSMIFDKRGTFGILHVMEFSWQRDRRPQDRIGGTDAALVEQWPGLLFDNTADYFSWGVSLSASVLPADVLGLDGERLQELVLRDVVYDWHPRLRALIRDSDPGATFALSVRTSDPLEPWAPGRVTVLGDAAHTMTPGRGAGANTALRDALVLRDQLAAVWPADVELTGAVGRYEAAMREYSAVAVRESLQGMHDNGLAHRPVRRALTRIGMRTGMRIADRIPAVKRRAVHALQRTRDSAHDGAAHDGAAHDSAAHGGTPHGGTRGHRS